MFSLTNDWTLLTFLFSLLEHATAAKGEAEDAQEAKDRSVARSEEDLRSALVRIHQVEAEAQGRIDELSKASRAKDEECRAAKQ